MLIVAWLAVRRPRVPTRGDALRFLLCGFLGIALYNALLNRRANRLGRRGELHREHTALLAAVFLGERFNRWGWLGSLVSLAGIAVIARGQPGGLVPGPAAR